MLYFRMILTLIVSLYTSRVVLNILGVEDFGTYNVIGGVVTMFGFFNGAMSSATQRFLSFDLGRGDYEQLRKTFNATQLIHIGIALFVFVLAETIGLWFVNTHLNLPEGRMEAARWVYHFSVLSFMVSIMQVPYNAVILARERMSVYAYVSILEVVLKLIIVFMLTMVAFDKLKLYGILLFVVSFIIAAIYRIYTLRYFNETRFELVKDKSIYKTLISFSGWNLFGGVAMIAKGQGISIILNIFFGIVVNAAQGVTNQVSGAISSFVNNFQMASNPQIIKSFAANDMEYMMNLIIRTSKLSFYLMFILSLPVMLEIEYILNLWLNLVPDYTAIFTILILINALIDSISGSIITSMQATGKIKIYQLVVGTLLILILPISYILFRLGYPPTSTFIVSICISILAFIFRLLLTKKQIPEFPLLLFIKEIIVRSIPVIFLSVSIPWYFKLHMHPGLTRMATVTFLSITLCFITMYTIGLNIYEKKFVREAITILISKMKKK